MKYILTSGCSFTNNLRYNPKQKLAIDNYRDDNSISWPYYLQKEVGDDYEVWNLGGATNDNVSIIRVLFYNIKELLRKAIYLPSEWNWDEDLRYREHTLKYHKDKNGFFFLTGGFGPPDHKEGTMNVLGLNKFMEEYDIKVLGESYINETLQWLETWAFFENFCVDNDIDTYWFWMRNNLSQEAFDVHFGAPDMDSDIPSKNIWLNNHDIL